MATTSPPSSTSGRTKGKDRAKEFATLAQNLKVKPEQLVDILKKRRSKLDPTHEHAKYISWLLQKPQAVATKKDKKNPAAVRPATTKRDSPASNTKVTREVVTARTIATETNNVQEQDDQTYLTSNRFIDVKNLHDNTKRALTEVVGVTSMTEIQSKTFEAAASGKDVLGRARTGTGKTLAFLVPALERLLQSPHYQPSKNVGVLIISPTRELATQIGDEAEKLITYHKDLNHQVCFGGTNMKRDVNQFSRRLPSILVATPGRLLDHLQSTSINGKQFGNDIMSQTPVVVLDETDRLLDMGFRRDLKRILSYLPKSKSNNRQTLLFSATIPPDLKGIMKDCMNDDYLEVDCINDGDGATHTNAKVKQSHVVIPTMDRYLSSVLEIVRLAMDEGGDKPKIVVFFPTARTVAFFAELFNQELNMPVIELHSKKSQSYRNRASDEFRSASSGILFTSDVSARGVDYPGVTQVIQFGIPESREQYIHRLGRTGRAGKEGKGWLVLGPFESLFLQELKGLDIPRNDQLVQLLTDPVSVETEDMLNDATSRVRKKNMQLNKSAKGAYQAFLGFYLGQMKRMKMRRKEDLVEIANTFSSQMGLNEVPSLTKQMIGKMGLKGVSGLATKIEDGSSSGMNNRRSGGDSRGGGSGKTKADSGHRDGRRKPNATRRSR